MKRHSLTDTVIWSFSPWESIITTPLTAVTYAVLWADILLLQAFHRLTQILRGVEGKSKQGRYCSVPRTEPGGLWGSGTRVSQPGWNLTFQPGEGIQNLCQKPGTPYLLVRPLPWNNSWFLKDKCFLTCIRVNPQFLPGNFWQSCGFLFL